MTERILHGKFVGGAVFYSPGKIRTPARRVARYFDFDYFYATVRLFDRYFKLSVNILKKKYEEVGRPKATCALCRLSNCGAR